MSGRYASYWNAFLLNISYSFVHYNLLNKNRFLKSIGCILPIFILSPLGVASVAVADWLTESVLLSVLGFNFCSTGLLPSSARAFTPASTSACVSFPRGIKPVWPLEDEDAAVVVGACVLASSGLSVCWGWRCGRVTPAGQGGIVRRLRVAVRGLQVRIILVINVVVHLGALEHIAVRRQKQVAVL